MFWHLIAAAGLFNLAFFLPELFGYCVLVVPLFLYLAVQRGITWRRGLLFSALVFIPHFYWLAWLLRYTSGVSILGTSAVCTYAVLGFVLPTTLWLWGTGRVLTRVPRFTGMGLFVVSCLLFHTYLTAHSLWFVGSGEGYPFLDFRIPLARMHKSASPFVYLQPDAKGEVTRDPGVMGQRIYQKLAQLNIQSGVIVAPETTFPFPLNEHPEMVELWCSVLPDDVHLLIGSQRKEAGKFYQTVYWLQEGRKKNYYDKQHRVIFTEGVPKAFEDTTWAQQLFLGEKAEISVGMRDGVIFDLGEGKRVWPQLCSELFMNESLQVQGADLVLWLVNDSWFPPYFRAQLARLAQVRANQIGVPLLYVTHEGAILLTL